MYGFAAGTLLLPNDAISQSQTSSDVAQTPDELLAELRDLHLPEPPSLWPPAPGWWLVGLILMLGGGFLIYRYLNRKSARVIDHTHDSKWQDSALQEHERLTGLLHSDAPVNQVVSGASVLMRRVALARLPREKAATVQNEQWLTLLDDLSQSEQYSNGIGRLLLDHPYRQSSEIAKSDVADLLALMEQTISQHDAVVKDV